MKLPFSSILFKTFFGIVVLFGPNLVRAQPTEFKFEFEDIVVIGEDESHSLEYLLEYPIQIEVGPEGKIYVVEYVRKMIRVYDQFGVYHQTIGQQGEGPGEFKDITSIDILADGRLLVYDGALRRLTTFDEYGTYSNSIVLDTIVNWGPGKLIELTPKVVYG